MKVLIAEDNPVSARLIQAHLEKASFETIVCKSGNEALDCLSNDPEIDLVITDLVMPEMDGFELIKRLKERPDLRELPILVTTGLADLESVRKAASLGCSHYLLKPVSPSQLHQRLAEVLQAKKPVLGERSAIMSRLGLDDSAYDRIVSELAALVVQQIAALEGKPAEEGGEVPPPELGKLREAAEVLGAQRTLAAVGGEDASTGDGGELTADQRAHLLGELRRLQAALLKERPDVPPPPPDEAPADEASPS